MPITLKLLALVESGDVKYSIKENVKNKVSGEIYDKVVVLDTNIFKGIPPRNWGKTFRNFISKHLIGKKFLTFDENGKEEIIEFAKPNERVTKNGANNSHKVIDKLSRKSDRNSKLVIVHSDEVINISEKQNENAEHSHQWLDENGWEFRNAFVMDKYGKIYSVTLNIAKSKDGRNILYDINKINEVGYGDVLSNAKGKRSSHINPNFVNNSISQSENNVNTKNDESGNDIKYSMGGLKAETADKSALEKAMELEKDGTDSEKIRKETGWFKGYDGKWRFEIDNSELEFKTDIEKNRAAAIELAKMKVKSAELEEKIVNNTATKAEENEYYNLDEKMIEYRKGVKLSDVINHPKLFEAYPQLKNVDVYYEISSVNRGVYSSNGNVIMLNPMHTIDEQKEAIIHEIQHAIQGIENFANGSNLEYWKNLGYSDEEAMAMYYNTAGEREARDVSARRDYNAEQRKNIRPDIDRKDVVFANSGDAGYLTDENIMQDDFENKVDQIENNTYNSNDVVIMGRTPKVLQDIGFNSLPVAMTKKHIYSVAVSEARAKNEGRYKQNTNYHDLGFNTVKQIYNKISDPLMVIAHPDFTDKTSRYSTHRVIALVDLSVNNKQVIAPIVVDFESRYNKKIIDVNLVATYFNKNNIHDLIKEAIALENNNQVGFYYLDKKRTQSIIKQKGYQLPSVLNNLSSNIIIRKIDSNVNKKINKITQSKQFVRWFGDWQNSPKSASKVVDGNGEPLVVYHQTGNDFTVFDTKHTGAGEFDSEMPTGIFMKPTNSNIGLSGNKQMALYANIRNPLTVNNRAELVRFYEKNIDGYKEARENINDIDSEYEASKKAKSLIDDYFRSSNYDGVIVNNDVGSFGRSTKTYIAFENTQVKSATNNIGTFDGKNPDIRYSIDDTKSSAEKYSEDDFENKVVYPNMDERQRAQILRNERIKLSSYDSKNALSPDDVASLENSVKRNAFKILRELGTKFNVYKNYTNENIELDFDYSKSGLKESIDKQGNITTNYTDFAKILTVFDDVIRNAVPIEVHTDKYVGTKRENPDLKYDYVLLSAFTDDNYIVPVELHIKEYKESYRINNKLYVSITLGKIKIEDNIITGSLLKNNNEVANSVPLSSEVSVPQLVSKVNEKLGNFYKYLPDELLSETQLKYKKIAAEKDRQRLSTMRNKTIQTENKLDIKYAIDDTKQEEVDFRKALTREEWASFYSSLNKYNQRDNLKISKNGILIPDEHNTQDYKLVYYNGNYQSPKVLAVYKLKNFDYTIHDNQIDFEELLNELRRSDENDKYAKAILANNTKVFGTVFERYGGHGWVTIDNTRESVSDRRNIKETADGAGTYENSEREVSGGLSEDKIPDIRYAIDDTLNDWLDDLPEGIDYEKVVEKNPVVAVAKIYNSASKTAESGLRQSQNVRLEEKD